jgi:aldose 1-epimerase
LNAPTPFGTLPDGRTVSRLILHAGGDGLGVELLDYGAIVRRLTLPVAGERRNLVLGFDSLDAYLADRAYQGCVVGRCANRIAKAWFSIGGEQYRVTPNEGLNTLHGGPVGFGRRLWSWAEVGDSRAVLTYVSADGEEGFPGRVEASISFTLVDAGALEIAYAATTDRPTPVNLTHHLYFNLGGAGSPTILDHELRIVAPGFTPVRPDLIPTGAVSRVLNTPFNLNQPRRIGEALGERDHQLALAGGGFDHNWALAPGADPALTLTSPDGVGLSLTTDQPGVQIYSGQGLGAPFQPFGGLAVEPQGFPDAVNRPAFPTVVLRPGDVYRRRTLYRFAA